MVKKYPHILFVTSCMLSVLLLFTSCSSSEKVSRNNSEIEENMDLTDRLYRLPGVRVDGQGENAIVQVRGGRANEIPRYMSPLFMHNGQVLQYRYQVIYQMMSDREIIDIRVLRNAEAAPYNSGSGKSIISITTKSD